MPFADDARAGQDLLAPDLLTSTASVLLIGRPNSGSLSIRAARFAVGVPRAVLLSLSVSVLSCALLVPVRVSLLRLVRSLHAVLLLYCSKQSELSLALLAGRYGSGSYCCWWRMCCFGSCDLRTMSALMWVRIYPPSTNVSLRSSSLVPGADFRERCHQARLHVFASLQDAFQRTRTTSSWSVPPPPRHAMLHA